MREHTFQIINIGFRKTTQQTLFEVKQINTGDIFKFSALDIYYDDALLEQFSPRDIREIVYVAAWELFLEEKNFLGKGRNASN